MTTRRTVLAGLSALAATGLGPAKLALATSWRPSKPINIVVPYPPGGLLDSVGRRIANALAPALGVPVITENRPGANTMIGAQAVARADPDGHTLLFTTDASLTIAPFLYEKMLYDAAADFVPVTLVMNTIECFIANSGLPANNLPEFIAYAKQEGMKINYGSYGIGSNAHLATEDLQHHTGVSLNHIPYKGQAELYQALLNGDIQFVIGTTGIATQYIQQGKLKLLATFNAQRPPLFPDVQTAAEQGMPELTGTGAWFGFAAPKGTPAAAIARLDTEIRNASQDPGFVTNLVTNMGLDLAEGGPQAMEARLETDRKYYQQIIERLGLRLS